MELEHPDDLYYLDSHEYVRFDGETATIGLSAFAVDELGDIVFVELPEEGDKVEFEQSMGAVESVKAASDLYSPVTGTVIEKNSALEDQPELLNQDPYGEEGWLIKVRLDDVEDAKEGLMAAGDYRATLETGD
ncbi:glycine decarboxylase complex H-protein [Synechocystis sp. PCC 6803]|jgi:glycine cleavage system H protein|uniref:Glycine cleavage system H protein n=1 Tax=Synechocystis sp. (strain ATCC 27184 / PCC 6803 / Kazusa) TaxID=1111708 RepID=GCSH_SYNY3|nr:MULTISPECIES: glycine cleavage system protein GcvH [unclassified Synechocystis]P73560.1 RecName: Full=Glycine cleavage system H protein [Synechocystis sp. PCC 6803 substr. Kazusa]BAM51341.1 glycine decarboxylase complex H-protein [Synechocystis sp. PCC 6803] [Bacillus subtilis BEST7613]AGF51289.1 glycine decarboxylase complex H-protein [Synechocystis sp. PCC 6803]ALJ67304.1 glycine cleavage system protein H [Synechocystis sp. PCC 6803]AVP89145.1 glycine cleavage system protein H [Synechocys